jgi:cell shape-determining protein MreD
VTRVLVFSLLGLLLITLTGPLQRLLGLELVVLDVSLVTVLYMAMAGRGVGVARQSPRNMLWGSGGIDWTGGLIGFILGYVTDVLGGGVKGIHCLTMSLVFLLALWAARHVYLAGTLSVVVVSFIASLCASAIGLAIRWATGVPPALTTLPTVISQAVLVAVAAPLLMRLYRLIDLKLARDPDRGTLCQ